MKAKKSQGRVLRPPIVVLGKSSLIPDKNLIFPAPNQFTHEVTRQQPFYFTGAQQAAAPDGQFQVGTKVVLLVYDGGSCCRVADGQGLYVETAFDTLKKIKRR